MPDDVIALLILGIVLVSIGTILGIFATVSNNRINARTLEDSNLRLMEMRKTLARYRAHVK